MTRRHLISVLSIVAGFLICTGAQAQSEGDLGTADTLRVDTVMIPHSELIGAVSLDFFNDRPLISLEATVIPDTNIVRLDSVSFLNSRLNITNGIKGWDTDPGTGALTVFYVASLQDAKISGGSGPIGELWFTRIDGHDSEEVFHLDTTTIDDGQTDKRTLFVEDTLHMFSPQFSGGEITLEGRCCRGLRGNANDDPGDAVDLADILHIANAVFLGGDPIVCPEEADVFEPSPGLVIDLSDILRLADAAFLGGPALPPCPVPQ